MDDDLSCTIYSALVSFLEHLGHSGWHSAAGKAASIRPPSVSPAKRGLRRGKLLGKRRREDEPCLLSCEKRPALASLSAVSHGMDGERGDPPSRSARHDDGWHHGDDPFLDPMHIGPGEARECLRSLCALHRLDSSGEGSVEHQTDTLLNFWDSHNAVGYEQLLYFVECCSVLALFPKLHHVLLGQVLGGFLGEELTKLRGADRKSQRLTILIDVYRIVARARLHRAAPAAQQVACELLLSCFESVAKQSHIWHRFAIRFALALNHCFFGRHSLYYSAIQDICVFVLNQKEC